MRILTKWKDISVSTKLYFVVGTMALLIAFELLTLRFAMSNLSAVRAFVGGEGLWSKAQKTAIIELRRYADTHSDEDFFAFKNALDVPAGDHEARIELSKSNPNYDKVFEGFKRGRIHPDDIEGVYHLVRRFYWTPYLSRALNIWAEADDLLEVLRQDAERLRELVQANAPDYEIEEQMHKIELLNENFSRVEDEFSFVLGDGSRWLEHVLLSSLLMLVLTVEATGLFLTISFSRNLTKSLRELNDAAAAVGRGIFNRRIPVRSKDELGQLAEALNAMTEKIEANIGGRLLAERASETKSAFLANMSHEIRTPLSAILGFADALRDPALDPAERDQYLGIIDRNGKALTKVIDDILDLSKVEAGGLVIETLEFSLPSLLQDAVDLFSATASSKGLALSLRIEPSARKAVCSDPTRLRQILTNVIGNALKFTSEGSIAVRAEIVARDAKDIVRISVKDTGIGLTEDQAEKLFSPFTQADGSTTRKYGGTGLGLALSRRLAQALGGNVFISESELSSGSTFIIEVENVKGTAPARVETIMAVQPLKNVSGMKVLAVEDSNDNRRLLDLMLQRQGINADFASNGREALNLAEKAAYDMVLMDIQMPEMDGFEALEKLRENHFKKPVVALTAHALKEERDRCLEAGFVEHLSKPIDERALLSILSKYSAPSA